jgi:threonine dehydrogenase-like Zn-dependent dehydrogenase
MSGKIWQRASGRSSSLAAVTQPDGTTTVARLDLPGASEDTGLLRVEASGVCGTDVSLVANGRVVEPTVLGHHIVGVVEVIGAAAERRWKVAAGDLVAVQEYLPCQACVWCRTGEFRFCNRTDLRSGGRRFGTVPVHELSGLWGGNAQFLHLPAEAVVHKLPDGMTPLRAVWLLPLANAFDWTLEAGALQPGATVVVVGPGQHGLACVAAAREAGAGEIVCIGMPGDEERLAIATRLGASHTLVTGHRALPDAVRQQLGERQVDVVINTSGTGHAMLNTLVEMAGKRARVVESGLTQGQLQLNLGAVTSRAMSIVGARGRSLRAIERAIASLGGDGAHALDQVPTSQVRLEEVDGVLRPSELGATPRAVHTVVRPWLDAT